ncbi:MAG: PAS domain S-box protein [Chloroflexota bacterium]
MFDLTDDPFENLLAHIRPYSLNAPHLLRRMRQECGHSAAYYAAFILICLQASSEKSANKPISEFTARDFQDFAFFETAKNDAHALALFDEMLRAYQSDRVTLQIETRLRTDLGEGGFELFPYPQLILDTSLRAQSANGLFRQIFISDAEAIADRSLFDLSNGAWNILSLHTYLEQANRELTAPEGIEIDHEFPGLGRRRTEVKAVQFKSPTGSTPLLLLTLHDVTNLRQAEEHAHFYKQLVEAAGQAIIATDLRGSVTLWNRAAERLYGWLADEVIGQNILDIAPAATSKQQGRELMSQLAKGATYSGEFLVQHREGTNFPVFITNSPVHDEHNRQVGIVGVSSIIERKTKQ